MLSMVVFEKLWESADTSEVSEAVSGQSPSPRSSLSPWDWLLPSQRSLARELMTTWVWAADRWFWFSTRSASAYDLRPVLVELAGAHDVITSSEDAELLLSEHTLQLYTIRRSLVLLKDVLL